MSAPGGCESTALVLAKRDGRLRDAEAASMDRHLAGCPACRAEVAAADRLAEHARRDGGAPTSELEHRRLRRQLLQRAARPVEERPRRARFGLALVAAAAVVGSGIAFAKSGEAARPAMAAPGARAAVPEVITSRGAKVRGSGAHRELEDGVVVIGSSDARIVVGSSTVEGSGSFLVEAHAGDVVSVSTLEGEARVEHDGATTRLEAGRTWRPPTAQVAAAAPITGPIAERTPAPAAPRPNRAAQGPAPRPKVSVAPIGAPTPATTSASPGDTDFREAVRSVAQGTPDAAQRLRAFRREHASDARAEDAAFLEIVALQRAGKADEARAAAARYLRSYPSGFRRAEAERIAAQVR